MPITLKDVAAAAGYSITTVSRALGGYADVNEETRAHIMGVAERLGYQPNLLARQLQARRASTIGLVIPAAMPPPDHDFFSLFMQGVSDVASRYQYDLLMSSQLTREQELDAYKRLAGGKRVDGVIVMRLLKDDPRIALLQELQHPFVVLGRTPSHLPSDFPYVDADSQWGIQQLVAHFIDYGHEHIGFISAPEEMALTSYRIAGYREALNDAEIPYRNDYIVYGDMLRDSGKQAAHALLKRCPKISAIVACNDVMALGAMEAVQEAGLRVGMDIAIGGFDDVLWARLTSPTLTTVQQPVYRMSELVTEMLLQIIDGNMPAQPHVLLQPELIIRESSGQPRR